MFALFIRSFIRSQQDFSVVGRPLLNWKIRRFSPFWRKASFFSQKGENVEESFTGKENLLVGLSFGGPSDPCM